MQTFDYVIVGAGSAGCALANRLSAPPENRVLLLEAGGSHKSLLVSTPGLVGTLWRSRFDWTYFTAPQRHVDGRKMHWPRGKVLGGSSAINYMIYIRGHRDNYDAWRDAGNEGWGYDDVLPLFKRSENNARGANAYHGTGGPLDVGDVVMNPMSQLLVDATQDALGVPGNWDFNGAEQEGAGRYQATIGQGKRCSTAVAFLDPVRTRPNLAVETGAQATGLILENGRVLGVRYLQADTPQQVRAAREVIVCAGAIGSPHLMLVSGIGPAEQLRAAGIPVLLDLPGVGRNLQDHIAVAVRVEDKGCITGKISPLNLLRWLAQHGLTATGPLASNVAEAGAFVHTRSGLARPDVQFTFLPVGSSQVCFDDETFKPEGHAFGLIPTVLYPESRGEIRLSSANPLERPLIDPRYFSEDADMRVLIEGVRMSQRILRAKALARCRGHSLSPLADVEDEPTLRAEIRRRCTTLFHPAGTCKMGDDRDAVVDASLRVRGLEGLRVADASIMPTLIGGNTNAPVIMIAEKAAELILATERPKPRASRPQSAPEPVPNARATSARS